MMEQNFRLWVTHVVASIFLMTGGMFIAASMSKLSAITGLILAVTGQQIIFWGLCVPLKKHKEED